MGSFGEVIMRFLFKGILLRVDLREVRLEVEKGIGEFLENFRGK